MSGAPPERQLPPVEGSGSHCQTGTKQLYLGFALDGVAGAAAASSPTPLRLTLLTTKMFTKVGAIADIHTPIFGLLFS